MSKENLQAQSSIEENPAAENSPRAEAPDAVGTRVEAPDAAGAPADDLTDEELDDLLDEGEPTVSGITTGERVALCLDGMYRWVYEVDMSQNRDLMFSFWKVLAKVGCLPAAWVALREWPNSCFTALWTGAMTLGLAWSIAWILARLAYGIMTALYKGKYVILFEMNEKGLTHTRLPRNVTKAQAMSWVAAAATGTDVATAGIDVAAAGIDAAAGATAAGATATGTNPLAALRRGLRSDFAKVRFMTANRRRQTIWLREPGRRNRVYVGDSDDSEFVWFYVELHTPRLIQK